jgi:molecular chaperone DnaK
MAVNQDIILGIDLGTTYSAMSYVDRFGKPNIIPNSDGHATTPSAVYFYGQQACVVGEEALKMTVVDPANVARFIKRAMGEASYELNFYGDNYTPQALSAFILRKLKEDAEEVLGCEVNRAVITVPAYFNAAQRAATAAAGEIAGLEVLSILNEPTAAAIHLAMDKLGQRHKMLVFDLGGGTFDVTLMEIDGLHLRTIASDGNAELGGKDWDDRLVNYVAERFVEQHGLDPRDDPRPYQELYERCLQAKIALSRQTRAVVPVSYKGKRAVVKIKREQFAGLAADLVQQCADTCGLVLEKARCGWEDLDEVLLVGGSTRMPMIREMITHISGFSEFRNVNPDEAVALGASLVAVFRHQPDHPALKRYRREVLTRVGADPEDASVDLVQLDESDLQSAAAVGLAPLTIQDASTHPLGVIVLDRAHRERVLNLIPESSTLPCERRSRFAYAYDNMTAVRVTVTEGHGLSRDEVVVVGEVVLDKLPPRPRGTPIEVVYRYTADQILQVDILDIQTGASRRARIDLAGALTDSELLAARGMVERARIG